METLSTGPTRGEVCECVSAPLPTLSVMEHESASPMGSIGSTGTQRTIDRLKWRLVTQLLMIKPPFLLDFVQSIVAIQDMFLS